MTDNDEKIIRMLLEKLEYILEDEYSSCGDECTAMARGYLDMLPPDRRDDRLTQAVLARGIVKDIARKATDLEKYYEQGKAMR